MLSYNAVLLTEKSPVMYSGNATQQLTPAYGTEDDPQQLASKLRIRVASRPQPLSAKRAKACKAASQQALSLSGILDKAADQHAE